MSFLRTAVLAVGMMSLVACGGSDKSGSTMNTDNPCENACGDNACGDNACGDNTCGDNMCGDTDPCADPCANACEGNACEGGE